MTQRMERTELELERERCFLIGGILPGRFSEFEDPLEELACLVDTAGGEVVGSITQRMERPHSRTYLGKGKFADMVDMVHDCEADTVVVDDNISPSQLSAIEEACRRKVIDRSEVILDIFASRAQTHQARLQVELAQKLYELPRLARKWTHLERLGGGIGTRGPGETQIETDRRLLRTRIGALRRELDQIEERKIREVKTRHNHFTVGLVGYTNAGKSTLLNALTGAEAFVEDRLFATLDTLTRKVELGNGLEAMLSDTVGFIRRLPHHLVASFHATLEEANQADLLLHVIDSADPLSHDYIEAVEQTLGELHMREKSHVYIFNKIDAQADRATVDGLLARYQPSLAVSAHTGQGIEELRALLRERAMHSMKNVTVRFSAADGRRYAMFNEVGEVQDTQYEGSDVILTVTVHSVDLERIRRLPGEMTEL